MHAATVAARLRPSSPGGSSLFIMSGSAAFQLGVPPGPPARNSSSKRRRATRPGMTMRKTGITCQTVRLGLGLGLGLGLKVRVRVRVRVRARARARARARVRV